MLRHMIAGLADAMNRHSAAKRTRQELSRLTDRELDDIGITRWDINNIARESGRKPQAYAVTRTADVNATHGVVA